MSDSLMLIFVLDHDRKILNTAFLDAGPSIKPEGMDRICIVNNGYKQEEAVIERIFPNFSAGSHLVRTKEQEPDFSSISGKT
jgi:hypothetical protein